MADLNREQFLQVMTDTYNTIFPGADQKELQERPSAILRDFRKDDGIEFGDPRYDWSASGAEDLLREVESYDH